ncbi:MAG: hypothetical protein MJ082_04150, partial [Clostridia bacterium]|nr:hypothetical protein [Clostridia bacterium]
MKKRFLSVFLVLAMMLSLVPAMSFAASAEEASGECGDGFYREPSDLKWSFNNGTLTISGV